MRRLDLRVVTRKRVGVCWLTVVVALCESACVAGYDSRYFEAQRTQKQLASDVTPTGISASSSPAGPPRAVRTLRMRIHADAQYLSQIVNVPKQLADLVEDANRVLEPALATHIEIERIESWTSQADERADEALRALIADDSGDGVDLVAGMVGALPIETDSLHLLGMASVLGKHLVVRAPGLLGEHAAIDEALSKLSEDERANIERSRKRHRALAVFLHEIGHCLGALHESDSASVMNTSYRTSETGFDAGSIALMRAALDAPDRAHAAAAQMAILEGPTADMWASDDRSSAIAILRAEADTPRATASATATAPATGGMPGVPWELTEDARARFSSALDSLHAGAVAVAYQTAKPLFVSYPNVLGVQDLRCQLATIRWLSRAELEVECAPLKRLSPIPDAGPTSARD